MADRTLTMRELNRATLARQMLLDRENIGVSEAVGRLAGLQAQVQNPPYIGLWTRLQNYSREDLTGALEERSVVRAPFVRSTLHLMTADDYLLLWPAIQPALIRALGAFFGKRARGLDIDRLVTAARAHLEEGPKSFAELRAELSKLEPDRDPEALAYAVRSHLPLVQVFPAGTWRSGGRIAYALAEQRLGRPLSGTDDPRELVFRYLRAFGPGTVKDVQTWAGLVRMQDQIEDLKPELRVFTDEQGNEILDLPDMPLPPADAPAPARFLPEYDNLVLSHADRTRFVPEEHRTKVFLSAARVRATFLLDGTVRGTWKIEGSQNAATLVVEPFEPLAEKDRQALVEEGERLVRFVEAGAGSHELRFAPAT